MRVKRIDHVGVAVSDKEAAERFMTGILGAKKTMDEPWEYRGDVFNWAYFEVGSSGRIELISSPYENSFINRHIAKRGQGFHHITIVVEDFAEAVEFLEGRGIRVLDVNDSDPDWKEAFIHPGDAFGMLIQVVETTAD